jgi:hypothetical protein
VRGAGRASCPPSFRRTHESSRGAACRALCWSGPALPLQDQKQAIGRGAVTLLIII